MARSPTPDAADPSREDRLDAAIASYLKEVEEGRAPDAAEWVARRPDLAPDLEAFLVGSRRLERLAASAPAPASAGPTPGPGVEGEVESPRRFGDYELLEELSAGGMGVVWKARQVGLDRLVALKMSRAGTGASPEDRLRFQIEARAAARLDHPGIVPILDVGEVGGQAYFTMKLIEGGDLSRFLPWLRTDGRAAARIVRAVAEAVHHAHARGVLHRDLKPANILLDGEGHPYVTDFGLAKTLGADSAVTQPGTVLGTPSYMAPEQVPGGALPTTTSSDVYALGAILYETLVGRPPFRGDTVLETLEQVRRREPTPPREIDPAVPRDLAIIALKCLEKDPSKRYPSALALAEDIGRYLDGRPIEARTAGPLERAVRWMRGHPALTAVVTTVALALVSIAVLTVVYTAELRRRAEESRARELLARRYAYVTRMAGAYEDWERGNCGHAVDLLASLVPGPDAPDFRGFEWYHLWMLAHEHLATLAGHEDSVLQVAFASGSGLVATASSDGTARLWNARSGQQIASLAHPGHVDALAFSPDGRTLATSSEDHEIRIWEVADRTLVASLRGHGGTVAALAFSPDGETLFSGGGDRTIKAWDLTRMTEIATLGGHTDAVRGLACSPDGRWLASGGQDHTVRIWDARELREVRLLPGHGSAALCLAWSPRNNHLAVGRWDGTAHLWQVDDDCREAGSFSIPGSRIASVAFSPDSRTLAMAASDRTIRLMDTGSLRELRALKGHGGEVNGIAFSADGMLLVSGSADRSARIWRVDSVGVSARSRLAGNFDAATSLALSSDSATAVTVARDHTAMRWDLRSGREEGAIELRTYHGAVPAKDGGSCIVVSRDALRVAFLVDGRAPAVGAFRWDPRPASLDEEEVEGGREAAPVATMRFSPDPGKLVAIGEDGHATFWVRAAVGEWRRSARWDTGVDDAWDVAISPDGAHMALARMGTGDVPLFDLRRGRLRATLRGHARPTICLAFSKDSSLLATGSLDRTARLWRVGTDPDSPPGIVRVVSAHTNAVASLAFSPDGSSLVTGSDDRSIIFWDLVTGEARATLRGHGGEVNGLEFARDGRTLLSVGGQRGERSDVLVWRAAGSDAER